MIARPLLLLIPLFLLLACGATPEDPTAGLSVEEVYTEAKRRLDNGEYDSAIDYYERLESRFPYGPYAEQSLLDVTYAYYKAGETETAILTADRFIRLHPNHVNVDYAYYLKGLASFKLEPTRLNRWFRQDPTERDPRKARESFRYFSELVNSFPTSRYTPDAIDRMYQLRDALARHELKVADFYYRRGAYVAAVNRAKHLVENYQDTPPVPEALSIMVRAYAHLELNDLAADALRVLELNYPQDQATRQARRNLTP